MFIAESASLVTNTQAGDTILSVNLKVQSLLANTVYTDNFKNVEISQKHL